MSVTTTYIGLVEGLHTWEVRSEAGELVGINQSADLTPAVPASVSSRQIRLWLVRQGIQLARVDAAIDAIPDPLVRDSVRVEWEYAPYIERSHPMLPAIAQALGLSEGDIDTAFLEAASI